VIGGNPPLTSIWNKRSGCYQTTFHHELQTGGTNPTTENAMISMTAKTNLLRIVTDRCLRPSPARAGHGAGLRHAMSSGASAREPANANRPCEVMTQ
jgi:hypothetical protein